MDNTLVYNVVMDIENYNYYDIMLNHSKNRRRAIPVDPSINHGHCLLYKEDFPFLKRDNMDLINNL
jgi:hypothetical protein